MAIDLTNPAHVSKTIDETAKAAKSLQQIIEDLNNYSAFYSVNAIAPAMTAQGAAFPPGFNLAPAQITAARNAISGALTALNGSLTPAEIVNLDRVVRNLGYITGGG